MDTTIFHEKDFATYPGGICLISMDGQEQILFCNDMMASLCGYDSAEALLAAIQDSYSNLVYPDSYIPLKELYQNFGNDEVVGAVSLHVRGKQGQSLFLCGTLAVQNQQDRKVWALYLVKDMSAQDRISGQPGSEFMSVPDFYDAMIQVAKNNARLGIFDNFVPVFLNLTNFKMYNAVHGWKEGNRLIAYLGASIRREFPQALVCHVGGDQFSLLARKATVLEQIKHLHDTITEYIQDSSVSFKAGLFVAQNDASGKTYNFRDNLFDLAKVAADSIKHNANRFYAIYDSHMGVSMYDRTHMMRSFEKALKDGEFEVYFQPQIRTCTGKVCGLEALSRWHDSEKGLLMPGEYIPMLEETGLISRLDYYVAGKAIQRIVWHLKTDGRALPVSINLSRVDFDVSDPVMEVERLVQVYDCPRHLLHIEVTESALVQDYGRLKQGLHDFQEAGYTCWLDDFGSAWSSLNALHNFHFDELKMDMGFMRNFNSESQSIVKSIVVMSRTLGIHTLTEGVETKEQVDFLSSLGCEKIQGYYYGKPMPGSQYISWLKGKNLEEELPEEAELLDRAGFIFLDGDAPAALFLFTVETIRVIRGNEAFAAWKPCREAGYDCCGALWKDILHVARGAIKTGADGRLALEKDGNPARLRVRILERGKGMALGKAELVDL